MQPSQMQLTDDVWNVVLNNAGVMPHSPLERLKIADWDRTIDVNIKGVLYGIAAALPHMQRQKSGHIINVSSVAGHKVRPGSAVYAAAKTAGFTFYTGSMFPASYKNAAIIAEHGSWNRTRPSGYRVMVVRTDGRRATSYEPLVEGFLPGISDDAGNRVIRVSYAP